MQTLPRFILIGSWAIFLLVWTVMAFTARKDVRSQSIDEREPYTIPFVASIVLLALSLRGTIRPEDAGVAFLFKGLVPSAPALDWASALIAAAGLALALWARLALGRNWSGMVALKDAHELVTSGPYALIRHPIYTALILLVLATGLASRSPLGLAALGLMILSCWIKLRAEEALMLEAFPDRYPAYVARTRRLIPWLI